MKNLPMDLLRTFVTINKVGGFTQAGELLGRSQPAISLQIKRLEEQLDVALFQRSGKLKLTEEGEVLYGYARTILETNDAAIARLSTPKLSGAVKVGIPNDFEASFLPVMLSQFTRAYPSVALEVSSDISVNLREDFKRGHYDFVMTMDSSDGHQFAEGDFVLEPLSWVTHNHFDLSAVEEIPLVVYPVGCVYRAHITQTLNNAGIPWRVVYSSSSLMGI
ncbi:MAG: LysR family transcriptional regulator, partial [Pseudomonadales bacterium]